MSKKFKPKNNATLKKAGITAKNNKKLAAVIDIGSNTIRLKIAQNKDSEMNVLEELRYPLSLGADTFSVGKIELDTLNHLCKVLSNFVKVIEQYGVTNVRTIATTALREASNKDYIVDIIMTRTGLAVDIANDVDEKAYIYREVARLLEKNKSDITESLVAYIGIGNLGIAYFEEGNFPFMHSLRLGSLRLSELFENVIDYGENYSNIIDEYQYGVIDDLKILMPKTKIRNFIACGSEVIFISSICHAEQHDNFMYISKENFLAQFDIIKGKTYDQLMEDYDISENRAELLFPFMSMCKTLLSSSNADRIIMPLANLRDSVLFEELFAKEAARYKENFDENIIIGSLGIAKRYCADMEHSDLITYFSMKLFEKLKKQCGFTKRDGLLLQAAAIMHDIGKFINIKNHDDHAYSIISGSDISGLNPEETEFVACITKFNGKMPSNNSIEFERLGAKKKVLVAKLSAILGLAETLDRSHKHKFDDFDISLNDNILTITVTTYKDIMLEEWAFKKRIKSFEQIFGIKAVLKRKKAQ